MYVCRKKVTVQKAGKITNNYNEKRNRKGQKMQGFIRKSNKYHMGFYTGTLIIPAELYLHIHRKFYVQFVSIIICKC